MSSRAQLRTWLRVVVLVLLAVAAVFLAFGALPAWAHDWYDGACCNQGDCYRTAQGEVQLSENGWFVRSTGEVVPFNDPRIKLSQDPFIHRCVFKVATPVFFQNGKDLGAMRAGDTRCLYIQGGM